MVDTLLEVRRALKVQFMRDLIMKMMQSETSVYSQLFFQQQIIAYEMASIIYWTERLAKSASPEQITKDWEREARNGKNESVEYMVENYTLGQLKTRFKKILPRDGKDDSFPKIFDDYVKNRNDLTHNMMIRFESSEKIQITAVNTRIIGDKVLRFFKKYTPFVIKIYEAMAEQRLSEYMPSKK